MNEACYEFEHAASPEEKRPNLVNQTKSVGAVVVILQQVTSWHVLVCVCVHFFSVVDYFFFCNSVSVGGGWHLGDSFFREGVVWVEFGKFV